MQTQTLRKIVKIIAGIVLILAGIPMLLLPGPGILTILAGFYLIVSDYEWGRNMYAKAMSWLKRKKRTPFSGAR
ncbi:PGPGW domain-containing protein [bacterium]|nr:PGPGW domain-containing protein [bacterium]